MILSRHDIEREIAGHDWPNDRLEIDPLPEPSSKAWQPASIDLTLAPTFKVWKTTSVRLGGLGRQAIDPREGSDDLLEGLHVLEGGTLRLEPGQFVLASTVERVRIPLRLVGRLEGRSSLGRLGIVVHVTAGYIDPGFSGRITLEIANLNPNPVLLIPGMRIAQLSLQRMQTACSFEEGYRGKYQGQTEVTGSRIERDFPETTAERHARYARTPIATSADRCGPGCQCGIDRGCPAWGR